MTQTRLRAYTPNGADLGPIPAPSSLNASMVLNDVGALSLTYDRKGPRSNLLGQPVELVVEVSGDGGNTWSEPPSARYLYLRDGRDPVKDDPFSVEAPSYLIRLTKVLVSFAGLDANFQRTFTDATAGTILSTLFTEAQARGAMAGMTWTFTGSVDTNGAGWGGLHTISYEPGKDLLAIMREMADLGWIDFRTQGRAVQVYAPDGAVMGKNRTIVAVDNPVPVTLRFGRDLTEAPFRRTWEGLANVALVAGDEGTVVTRTAVGALAPWGNQETYVTAQGVTDVGTLSVVGDAALTLTSAERAEYTYGLTFRQAKFLPFRDYEVGAYVWCLTDGATAPTTAKVGRGRDTPSGAMRVRQITLTRDNDGVTAGNLVVNDRFSEADIRQQRLIQSILNGGSVGTGGGDPTPPGPDILAPAQVTGVTIGSAAYLDAFGQAQSQITVDWADVTTNADATATTDVAQYEVQFYRLGTTAWSAGSRFVPISIFNISPLPVGSFWTFRVRAIDSAGNEGAWSAPVSITTVGDTTNPAQPSAPSATTRLGVLRVNWNGLAQGGGAMDADLSYVEVHVNTVNGWTPTKGDPTTVMGRLNRAGQVSVANLTFNSTYYVRLLAVDTTGNAGPASIQATAVVAPLVDVSNFPDTAMDDLYARTGHFIDLVAANFSANLITATMLDIGSLFGQVVTGLTLRTDVSPNQRIELVSTPANEIRFYTGNAYETAPGRLYSDDKPVVSGQHDAFVRLETPRLVEAGNDSLQAFLNMSGRVNTTTHLVDTNMGIGAEIVQVTGPLVGSGGARGRTSVRVAGELHVQTGGPSAGKLLLNSHTMAKVIFGEYVVTTDGGGYASFSFPAGTSFVGSPQVIAQGGNGESVYVLVAPTYRNNGGFTAQFFTQAGAVIASSAVRCLFVAGENQ